MTVKIQTFMKYSFRIRTQTSTLNFHILTRKRLKKRMSQSGPVHLERVSVYKRK